jgi:4-methoxybenzoate monooxygenase (O-demethylating)
VQIPSLSADPFGEDELRAPYHLQQLLRDAGPVVWLERYGTYGAARHEQVTQVLQSATNFSSAAGVGLAHLGRPGAWREPSPLVESDPPRHSGIRRAMDTILSPRIIRGWQERFAQEAERLCDQVLQAGSFDGVRDFARPYVHTVFPAALGVESHPQNLVIVGHHSANAAGPRNRLYERSLAALESIKEWYLRQQTPAAMIPGGFGAQVFAAETGGQLPPGVAGPVLRTLLRGGLDTTISGIASTLWFLARLPEKWAALRASPELVEGAFAEALRLESPTPALYRTTTGATELAGCQLAADTKIQLFVGAANRDPRCWSDADVFEPTRRARNALIFGNGPHHCLGQRIARLEAQCLLGAFVRRVATVELDGTASWDAVNMLRTLEALPLRVVAA